MSTLLIPRATSGLYPARPAATRQDGSAVASWQTGLSPDPSVSSQSMRLLFPGMLRPMRSFKSTNIMFWARRGQGKSLSTVWLAKLLRPVLTQVGWKIKSNIHINFADYCDPLLGEQLNDDHFIAWESLLCIDEVTELVPSIRATGGMNLGVASLVRQIRKLHSEIVCNTQFPTDVSRALLRQTDIYILCRSYIPKDSAWNPVHAWGAFIVWYLFDVWGQWTGNAWASRYWPPPIEVADKRIIIRNLPSVWNDFDTDEQVFAQYGSAESKARIISHHWDAQKLETQRLRLQQAEQEGALGDLGEYQSEVDANLQLPRVQELVRRLPTDIINVDPKSFKDWLEAKTMMGAEFFIGQGVLREARRYAPSIKTLDDLKRALDTHGIEIQRKGDRDYGVKRNQE